MSVPEETAFIPRYIRNIFHNQSHEVNEGAELVIAGESKFYPALIGAVISESLSHRRHSILTYTDGDIIEYALIFSALNQRSVGEFLRSEGLDGSMRRTEKFIGDGDIILF